MHSYSPVPESVDVPLNYRQMIVQELAYLRRNPPRTIEQLGPWSAAAHELIGQLAKDPLTPDQVWATVALLAHALCTATGWKLSYCFDILNDGLEHP